MLYLIDEPMADLGFRTAAADDDARVVLIQDGVLLDLRGGVPDDPDCEVCAVRRDVEVRGADLDPDVTVIDYDDLVSMLFDHEVKTFV
jgi:tRNA 2-thiouridine synthesizing protein B